MKKSLVYALLFTLTLAACISTTENEKAAEVKIQEPTKEEMIQRGAYLLTIGGCNDCHTPKKMTEHGPV
ncbi:MAG: diheme cytochrome c-553, partial [Bacteroidota bacterium]|nr:diheme cytochrome c-553 [Bacteroidota bacterium]MDX5429923.1 diheme cytochrome c-553 [Bacteroidota bacterium]MDX5468697.1 diheme cytochrome c-553 [Bacteroidota bacterium]